MKVIIKDDYAAMSRAAADMVIQQLQQKPASLFCFPSGDTPTGMLKILVDESRSGKIDFTKAKFVGLDEWVGMDKHVAGSCGQYMYQHFFDAVPIRTEQITFFDARSSNLKSECTRVDQYILAQGGVDLLMVGVGLNGHIGLNEPGSSFENYCHVRKLDQITKDVAQKYFPANTILEEGITLGIRHMMEAKTSVIMAGGEKKAPIIQKIVEGPVGVNVPGTALRNHSNSICLLDRQAASKLTR